MHWWFCFSKGSQTGQISLQSSPVVNRGVTVRWGTWPVTQPVVRCRPLLQRICPVTPRLPSSHTLPTTNAVSSGCAHLTPVSSLACTFACSCFTSSVCFCLLSFYCFRTRLFRVWSCLCCVFKLSMLFSLVHD